jgi:drug/metabolite transporter (DMT)-like permease
LILAVLAGIGFGGFFVCIAQVEAGSLFAPLAVAKLAALAFGVVILILQRRPIPSPTGNPLALLAGVFDAGGNLFYLIAVHYIALAVAAVLSSMYPAATVILAMIVLRERVQGWQALGVILCLAAVILVTI